MAQQQKGGRKHPLYHWQAHIRKQQESNLSREEYCRQNNLPYHAITYWQRKLSQPSPVHTALVPSVSSIASFWIVMAFANEIPHVLNEIDYKRGNK